MNKFLYEEPGLISLDGKSLAVDPCSNTGSDAGCLTGTGNSDACTSNGGTAGCQNGSNNSGDCNSDGSAVICGAGADNTGAFI